MTMALATLVCVAAVGSLAISGGKSIAVSSVSKMITEYQLMRD